MAKRFLIGLLAAILLIFPGCHKEIDDVLGQWRAELDIKTVLFQRLEKECPGISNVMAIEKLPVTLVLTFLPMVRDRPSRVSKVFLMLAKRLCLLWSRGYGITGAIYTRGRLQAAIWRHIYKAWV